MTANKLWTREVAEKIDDLEFAGALEIAKNAAPSLPAKGLHGVVISGLNDIVNRGKGPGCHPHMAIDYVTYDTASKFAHRMQAAAQSLAKAADGYNSLIDLIQRVNVICHALRKIEQRRKAA